MSEEAKRWRKRYNRTGCLYAEVTNNGNRYARGCGLVRSYKARFVAEFVYHGRRYRMRSTNELNCKLWLMDMRARYAE